MATLTLNPLVRAEPTEADRLAARNRDANLAAAERTQPRLAALIATSTPDVTWVFARDGFLTAFEPGEAERWHTGCSVPLMAARAMLKTMGSGTGVACFLGPTHAAQVRVAFDHLQPEQALICIVPDGRALDILLRCENFSAEIERGRLWFAWGESWPRELGRLLEDVPGLPTPSRFIRLPHADPDVTERLVGDAQRVFTAQNNHRSIAVGDLRDRWAAAAANLSRGVCVIARSHFRLWNDAGQTLRETLDPTGLVTRHFDPDAPAGCSPLALAASAAASDAVVAADLARADAPKLVPVDMPWVTWVTTPHIPASAAAGPNDRLLVADPAWREAARTAGWPAARVGVAGWPTTAHATPPAFRGLALIADTCGLDASESLKEFSSHLLLWEKLRALLLPDPFTLPPDPACWVREHARRDGVAVETLDVAGFVDRLVVPAYQQALADALVAAGLPLRLHGRGWADLPRFRAIAAGPVTSREQLATIAQGAAALVRPTPAPYAHPSDAMGRPVVRAAGRTRESFVRDAGRAIQSADHARPSDTPLSASLLRALLAPSS